jgi:NAD(P)-dependent dehydrogenase (short-subunit alcohol dehydrogenase family)
VAKLFDKVAIITGSTKGIGKVIAQAFVREGAKVVITSSSKINVDTALNDFPEQNVFGQVCDVSNCVEVEKLVSATVERFGKLDVFINNAGISDTFYNITDGDPEEWGRVVDINLKGTYYGTRAALNYFLETGNAGKIINMAGSGTDKKSNTPYISAYGSSKAAIARFTFAVAEEYKNHPVSIMLLHPGLVRTEMIRSGPQTPEMKRQQATFQTIVDIFSQPPSVAALLAVKMASEKGGCNSGDYLSALDGKRKKWLLFSYPFRKLFHRIDRTNY